MYRILEHNLFKAQIKKQGQVGANARYSSAVTVTHKLKVSIHPIYKENLFQLDYNKERIDVNGLHVSFTTLS